MRKPPRYSATRVKQFDECRRKWHLYNVQGWEGVPEKQGDNPAFAWGTALHLVAEEWLRDGKRPPNNEYGRAFIPGIGHWPTPKTSNMLLEEKFAIKIDDTLLFRGVIDVLYLEDDGSITVGDHKTTKNLRYAMTEAQLSDDVQAIAYGYYAARMYTCEVINLKWVYYSKVKLETKCVLVSHPRQYFIDKWEEIADKSKKMLEQWTENKAPKDIPGTLSSCSNYGGCEFRDACSKLNTGDISETIATLMSRHNKKKGKDHGHNY